MYADRITDSMNKAISETNRRRTIQMEYNQVHDITPKTVQKSVRNVLDTLMVAEDETVYGGAEKQDRKAIEELIENLTREMKIVAKDLQFERAAQIRDKIQELKQKLEE